MYLRRRRDEEKRENKRKREKETRRKIVNLAYLAEHGFQYFHRWNPVGFRFETTDFVLRYCNNGNSFV